jgi:hypothetical protein
MDENNFLIMLQNNNINIFETIQNMLNNIKNNSYITQDNYNINNDDIQISIEFIEENENGDNGDNGDDGDDGENICEKNCYKTCSEINKTLCKPIKIKKDDSVLSENCMICMDDYKINQFKRILPTCNHYFHKKCIDKWFKKTITCPICRVKAT